MSLLATKTFYDIFCGPITGITWEDELVALLRVFVAGLIGFVMGFERSRRKKDAGIATHIIVGAAAALFTCLSTSLGKTLGGDSERIAAQVVSGVGFLGAGMIFFRRESVRGITTAAGIWATAALGMCVASGQMIVAFGVLVVIIVAQIILHTKRINRHNMHMLFVKFSYTEEIRARLIEHFGCDTFHRFKVSKQSGNMVAEAVIYPTKNFYAYEISDFMAENDEIESIERLEDL